MVLNYTDPTAIVLYAYPMVITSYILCSFAITLYIYLLWLTFKRKNTQYMQAMLFLFICSQVLWCLAYQLYLNAFKNDAQGDSLAFSLACFGIYNALYSVVHWIFAFHYYSTAVCL